MRVWIQDDKAVVQCSYNEKELVKAIGDFKFDKDSKCWIFPINKIVSIIDHLKVDYDTATEAVYQSFRKEKAKQHALINRANEIKNSNCEQLGLKKDHPRGDLFDHQVRCIELAKMFGSYALFLDSGTCKTRTAIQIIDHFRKNPSSDLKKAAMVVAPLNVLKNVWEMQIKQWSDFRFINLWGKLEKIWYRTDIFIINYEQFKILDSDTSIQIENFVDILIVDESSCMKNNKSDISKALIKYHSRIPHRFVLSGTPATNNIMEYWGQMCLINPELLGSNFYKFRNTYFKSIGYGGFQYVPVRGAKEAILEIVSQQSISVRKEDCFDMPEKMHIPRMIDMDDIQKTAYDEMNELNLLAIRAETSIDEEQIKKIRELSSGNFDDVNALNAILAPNQLSKIMKLREITAGFVMNADSVPVLISESKMNALRELIAEIPADKSVVIWCQFHWEIERIHKEFENESVMMYGEMSQKEKDSSVTEFCEQKKRLFIANPKTGGKGLNLQAACSYMIWFSLSYSGEDFWQANDRIWRANQKNKCTYYYLLAKGTIDETIYKAVGVKASLITEGQKYLSRGH